ncbi:MULTISPECIES: SAM-dependent methyltransferase [Actinomadura]|uniref:SAM-dependent methyltransferase n=1 Tax=Actinomadura yumaensis TaxID=111807 RepID=A0ABW2CX66_9ACTN|nr:SAM-dependent methyltransferase [Actinomadura sp. J1-007]MWK38842.1 SAM-dependent methyltransferase [Actinomadura sp. J1-007]
MSDTSAPVPPGIDTSVPHPARVWDYWLGGKDHFAADREAGEHLLGAMPDWVEVARADRQFLARAVRYLVREAGIRQFLDIGTGIPTANNTHEVAQSLAPESRIVYVDNDPIVLVHARALLTSTPEGATAYLDADVRDPDRIVEAARATLDLSEPVAVTMLAIMEFITDQAEALSIVGRLLAPLPSGSHLAIAQPVHSEAIDEAARRWNESGATPVSGRHPEEIGALFAGLELVEPGLVPLPKWRPDEATSFTDRDIPSYCAVGRKP